MHESGSSPPNKQRGAPKGYRIGKVFKGREEVKKRKLLAKNVLF